MTTGKTNHVERKKTNAVIEGSLQNIPELKEEL
jgi:hypothetical protein